METFYWHDYETFGVDPIRTRPAQFGGLRTDSELNVLGEPMVLYCQPSNDFLPSPTACLITGITPDVAKREGVVERDFAARIHAELSAPGTCGVGYNSLRFDDHVTRMLLYRNFFDPYAREWRDGNSRWDLIDVARLCYALRPEGVEWPLRDDQTPSFKLTDLSAANGFEHENAHDALADVYATIDLARQLRSVQPRLFAWCLSLRRTDVARRLLNPKAPAPVVHASGRIAAARGGVALMTPLAPHPTFRHGVVCFDLAADPGPLIELGAGDVADRVFTPAADLPEDVERLPLKVIHANRAPVIAPMNVLQKTDTERIQLDVEVAMRRHERLRQASDLEPKLAKVFRLEDSEDTGDAEFALYSGGFIDRRHSARFDDVRAADPGELAKVSFNDERLDELLFRFRARNHPDTLSEADAERWQAHRKKRLIEGAVDGVQSYAEFDDALAEARSRTTEPADLAILDRLDAWARGVMASLDR